eukprot:scaffold1828_cov169-Amphora_coffeaeformis.AAC.13
MMQFGIHVLRVPATPAVRPSMMPAGGRKQSEVSVGDAIARLDSNRLPTRKSKLVHDVGVVAIVSILLRQSIQIRKFGGPLGAAIQKNPAKPWYVDIISKFYDKGSIPRICTLLVLPKRLRMLQEKTRIVCSFHFPLTRSTVNEHVVVVYVCTPICPFSRFELAMHAINNENENRRSERVLRIYTMLEELKSKVECGGWSLV